MGINVYWDNDEKTVMFIQFEPQGTWNDFYDLDKQTIDMLETVDHKVCYIVDLSQSSFTPRGMSLTKVRQVLDFRHPRSDVMVLVGMNRFIRIMLDTVLKAMGGAKTNIQTAQTLDQAYAIVNARLKALSANV